MAPNLRLLSSLALSVFVSWAALASRSQAPFFLSETPVTENQTRHVLEYQPRTSLAQCKAKVCQ